MSRVDKGNAKIISFYYPDINNDHDGEYYNSTPNDTLFDTNFDSYGYYAYVHNNIFASTAYDYLGLVDVFVFHGHAEPAVLYFHNGSGTLNGDITPSSLIYGDYRIEDYPGQNSLAKLRCVLYIGCSTAEQKNNVDVDFLRSTYNEGAHFVLGTMAVIATSDNSEWLRLFLLAVDNGACIIDAVQEANRNLGSISVIENNNYVTTDYPYNYVGDGYQYLN